MGDLSLEKVLLFVVLALPGLVAIRCYSLWQPTPLKDWKESLTDAVFYSTINFFVWAIVFPSLVINFVSKVATPGFSVKVIEDHILALFLYTLITPLVLTLLWYRLRIGLLHKLFGMDHPVRTGWDWIIRNGGAFYIRFVLKRTSKDGNPILLGGYYADKSFAATYPQDPEIYVERLHYLDEDGEFGEAIGDTKGMVIKVSDCERIEIVADPSYCPVSYKDKVLSFLKCACCCYKLSGGQRKSIKAWLAVQASVVFQSRLTNRRGKNGRIRRVEKRIFPQPHGRRTGEANCRISRSDQ